MKIWLSPLGPGTPDTKSLDNASFDSILEFEKELAEYTGAPYAIMTDCCTHAIEMCLRYDEVTHCTFTPYTYLSIPMTMVKLGISYDYDSFDHWHGEYQFCGTRIWDSARMFERGMYRKGQMQCLSFGNGKPLEVGHGGAILLDDKEAYKTILRQRYDGRDLTKPWGKEKVFKLGYHYKPSIEDAVQASTLLRNNRITRNPSLLRKKDWTKYPDCRKIKIEE